MNMQADVDVVVIGAGVVGLAAAAAIAANGRSVAVVARGAAVWSRDAGRVDASALVLALRGVAEGEGAALAVASPAASAAPDGDGIAVALDRETVRARLVVNAAGLHADEVSRACG